MNEKTARVTYVPFKRTDYQLRDALSPEERDAISTGYRRSAALDQPGSCSSCRNTPGGSALLAVDAEKVVNALSATPFRQAFACCFCLSSRPVCQRDSPDH